MTQLGVDTAEQLLRAGTTISTALGIGAQKSDNFNSGASNEFFINNAPERATGAQITANQIAEDGNSFAQSVAPELATQSNNGIGMTAYPPDLGEYYMSFDFYDYQRPNPFDKPTLNHKNSFALPLPLNLVENHKTTWEEKTTGFVGDVLDILTSNDYKNNPQGKAALARGVIEKVGERLALASFLPGDIEKQIGQSIGAILNPHLSQFFEGPTFQSFTFEWTFHPRSPDESSSLKTLCQQFKQYMLPSRAVQDVSSFLAYPSIVQATVHPDIGFPMKRCAIDMVNIDYAPGGLVFFKGTKLPRVIKLTVSLKAIEYFLSEDFGGTSKWQNESQFQNTVTGQVNQIFDNAKSIGTDLFKQGTDLLFKGQF